MRYLIAMLALLLAVPSRAEAPVPLMWKVEAGKGTVWLLGSLHVLKPGDYPLDPAVDAAFGEAERLVFELAPEAMAAPETAATALRYAHFDDGRTLRGVLPEASRARLAEFLGSEAAQAAADPYEPWFMSVNLVVMSIVRAGFDPALGLDQHLMQRAAAAGKPGAGLESADDQFRAMDGIPLAEQVQMLDEALTPAATLHDELAELHARWRAGDAAALEHDLLDEMRRETPAAFTRLVVERNRRWQPQIEAMLAGEDDVLVVVGSLHLLGEEGLVAALARAGFTVERVVAGGE